MGMGHKVLAFTHSMGFTSTMQLISLPLGSNLTMLFIALAFGVSCAHFWYRMEKYDGPDKVFHHMAIFITGAEALFYGLSLAQPYVFMLPTRVLMVWRYLGWGLTSPLYLLLLERLGGQKGFY